MDRPPLRVGMLHDFPRPDGGASFEWAVRLGMAEVETAQRLPAPIAFIHEPAHGGDDDVRAAFVRLCGQGVSAILGPAISDGALAVLPLTDDAGIPCLHYAGTDQARGSYLFHFQIGSLEDEPALLVGDLMRRRLTRVALIQDASRIGDRLAEFFHAAAAMAQCAVSAAIRVGSDGADCADAVADAQRSAPDALMFVGLWRAAHAVARATRARGWRVPALANSALMYGHADPNWARDWEGWRYVDTYSETNPRFGALSSTMAAAGRTAGPGEAGAFDMGRLLAEGMARAPDLTPAGIRAGLERVKALPAATGRAGTVMGFGNWDRGALKGPYLVLREWRGGQSIEIAEPAA